MAYKLNNFCRLCATMVPEIALLFLQDNSKTRAVIMSQLALLKCNVDWSRTDLPETICATCGDSLQSAFEFVNIVETAQSTLDMMLFETCFKTEKDDMYDETKKYKTSELRLPCPSADDEPEDPSDKDVKEEDEELFEIGNGIDNDSLLENDLLTEVKGEDMIAEMGDFTGTAQNDNMLAKNEIENNDIATEVDKGKININTDEDTVKGKNNNKGETENNIISADVCIKNNSISDVDETMEISNSSEEHSEHSNKSNEEVNTESEPSQLEPKYTWKDYIWTCANCGFLCGSFDELQTHSLESHNSCNRYRCTDCKRTRTNLLKFLKHVEIHRKCLKLSCFKCLTHFSHIGEARLHKILHMPNNHAYSCDGCWRTFPSAEECDAHFNIFFHSAKLHSVKKGEKRDYVCSICNKALINQGSLTVHKAIHTVQKPYICYVCGKTFKQRGTLNGHLNSHNVKSAECKICKETFKTKRSLKNHVNNIHMEKKVSDCVSCDKCGKLFKNGWQLKQHSLVHSDNKPFSCTHCEKTFARKGYLTKHMLQHTGEKPYSCKECEHDFTNQANYIKHMKRKHNGEFRMKPTKNLEQQGETEEITEWKRQITERKRGQNLKEPE